MHCKAPFLQAPPASIESIAISMSVSTCVSLSILISVSIYVERYLLVILFMQ